MQVAADARLAVMRAELDVARAAWPPDGEVVLDSGLEYVPGTPVRVLVRK